MRIQSGEMIAGQPALALRTLMQQGRANGPTTSGNTLELVLKILDVDPATARQVLQALRNEGYVEPSSAEDEDERWYTTIKGNALANATARKPITRQTADRVIKQLLERVRQVNAGDYAYRVKQVIVFGSYLSDSATLGDVDISILLEDRYPDVVTRKAGHDKRIAAAQVAGRHFRDYLELLTWPQQEVLLLLKHHSPSLSLHDERREQVRTRSIPSKILFNADSPVHAHSTEETGR